MRIRTIKPEFFLHEDLHALEAETGLPIRVAYIGLWCAADRDGRFEWRPQRLKAQILPYDDVDFSRVLHACTTRGLLVHYAWGTREFGCIPSFPKHQVINNRERDSEIPPPDEATIEAALTRAPRVPHACPTPLNLDKAEGNKEQGTRNREQGREQGHTEGECEGGKKVGASTSRVSRFVKPSMDEWKAYCATLSESWKGKDVESAYDHYEANGWMRGKTKIKDWKACARTCFRNWQERNPNHSPTEYLTKNENGELEW